MASGATPLDLTRITALSFEAPDPQRFPGLKLAWETLSARHGTTAVLNAANEVAVAAFLEGTIRFDQIHTVNLRTLDAVVPEPGVRYSLEALLALDEQARQQARYTISELSA
jgi:1-deoxy-D-xylulose-5-phosphate reductoisomerase